MSSLIAFTFDPMDEGVHRAEWDKFVTEHRLVLEPGNNMFYQGGVEVEYISKRHVTFSANGNQDTRDNQILLAIEFGRRFGGSMYLSPELYEMLISSYTSAVIKRLTSS